MFLVVNLLTWIGHERHKICIYLLGYSGFRKIVILSKIVPFAVVLLL